MNDLWISEFHTYPPTFNKEGTNIAIDQILIKITYKEPANKEETKEGCHNNPNIISPSQSSSHASKRKRD